MDGAPTPAAVEAAVDGATVPSVVALGEALTATGRPLIGGADLRSRFALFVESRVRWDSAEVVAVGTA